jgi:hypothetical protein
VTQLQGGHAVKPTDDVDVLRGYDESQVNLEVIRVNPGCAQRPYNPDDLHGMMNTTISKRFGDFQHTILLQIPHHQSFFGNTPTQNMNPNFAGQGIIGITPFDSEFFNKIFSSLVSLLLNYVLLDGLHSFSLEVYVVAIYVLFIFVSYITPDRFLKCAFTLYKIFDQNMIKKFG